MKLRYHHFLSLCASLLIGSAAWGQLTPQTISMAAGTDNATAFGANGTLGTNVATFYAHWDNTYLYLGWDGGNYTYSSDMFYAAIDVFDGQGSNGAIEGVDFNSSTPDFYVVYENNINFYGAPASNGDGFELYTDNGANGWSFISRVDPADNSTSGQVDFGTGQSRFRIAWADLGVTPGASQPLGLTFWTNNSDGNYQWAAWPNSNPFNAPTPLTMTHKVTFASTAAGINPSADGTVVALSTPLPVELLQFEGTASEDGVRLAWTAIEQAFSHYEIQRLGESREFATIGEVQANGIDGEATTYTFLDRQPLSGTQVYRLAMVDIDGTINYSDQVEVTVGASALKVSPQPSQGALRVELPTLPATPVQAVVRDLQGRAVWQAQLPAQAALQLDLQPLAAGSYFLQLNYDGQQRSSRITITE